MKEGCIALMTLFIFSSVVSAGEYLNADETKALLTGKTFDGFFLPKNKKFSVYEAPDGTHNVLRPNGKRDKGRTWFVNDKGQHCTTHKKWKEPRCSYVKDVGNGEYHKFSDQGEHTHTFTNFRDGNQL